MWCPNLRLLQPARAQCLRLSERFFITDKLVLRRFVAICRIHNAVIWLENVNSTKIALTGFALRRRTAFSFLILSLSILTDIFLHVWAWVSRYQNVSILDLIEAKDDGGGGGNWSYRTCKAPVKSSPTNQYPVY